MTDLEKIIFHALSVHKVAILLKVGDKVILVSPKLLKDLPIDSMAVQMYNSDLDESEILEAIEILDKARTDTKTQ